MVKSWKTTVSAAVAAAGSFVLFAQTLNYIAFPKWALGMAAFIHIGGLANLGIAAKDADVSGDPPHEIKPTVTDTTNVNATFREVLK
jgi:hypothetical protein